MKFLLTNNCNLSDPGKKLPLELEVKTIENYCIFLDQNRTVLESESSLSLVDGYLRDMSKDINPEKNTSEQVILEYCRTWPLPYHVTGSFCSVVLDKISGEIIISNDVIGIYPLYYMQRGENLYISNSIILMGVVTGAEPDDVGVTQRCMPPEFSNIGSRTILKDCKRLLPGELKRFGLGGELLESRYDNTLYKNLSDETGSVDLVHNFWNGFKEEVSYILNDSTKVNIALSGGIDSRTILASIPDEKEITCLTYGAEDNYETKVAGKLAKIKNACFKSFSEPYLYFPNKEMVRDYSLKTEALYLNSWLEILENSPEQKTIPLFTGDFTTVLTGRTIKKFSGKKIKPREFINHFVLGNPYNFEENNSQNFRQWKEEVIHRFSRRYTLNKLSQFENKLNREKLIQGLKNDLDELFVRIEDHDLNFIELADELFTWYTHARIPMGKQVLVCNSKFKAYCPSMSLRNLRMASSIHPNSRLGFRFVKNLFREAEEFRELKKIPTSQAPLVAFDSPDLVRFPIWAMREKVDQMLIRRMVRQKDPAKRYRLFKSNNWVQVYQNPNMEKNIRAYFAENHLGKGYFHYLFSQAKQRKNLEQWPFANLEIINAAGLNAELDLIKKWS